MSVTCESTPPGGAAHGARSSVSAAAEPVASFVLASAQHVFSLRRRAQQVAAALLLEKQDGVRLATALSELGRDRLHCHGLKVSFSLTPPGRPTALLVTLTWRSGPSPAPETLNLARRLVRVDYRPGQAAHRIEITQPLAAEGTCAAEQHARLAEVFRDGPQLTEADDLRAQTQDLIATLEETRAQREELRRLNEELEETNRGVLALYSELTQELEATNSGVLALHTELEDKRQQLLQASEAKTRFWTNISHELRTPVNSVVALSTLLLSPSSPGLTPEQCEQIELIASSGHTLLALVGDLLDVAKAEAGHLEINPQRVDLRLLVGHLSSLVLSSHGHDTVTLRTPGLQQQPVLVTDETLLVRILRNLLENALKFTERGEVRLDVTVAPDPKAPAVLFTITDTGIGIPAAELSRVFEAFYQVRGPHQQGQPGTGLGLPYARTLTELLGGTLTLTSTQDVGTRVEVRLPDLGHQHPRERDDQGSRP
ncbi:sensor histidine kinase [Streptomyces flavofungini]|uniref:sensor histidine kinase n=1 Tax=Streptomyces flavofungini TaxID=68200 RepID=UPI003F7E7E61